MKNEKILEIKNLSKKIGERTILTNINLNVNKGDIIGIIGRNGSGKTVLLKILAQLYIQTSGDIILCDKLDIKNDFGFLIDTGFLESETGYYNLKLLSLLKNKISDNEIYNTMNFVGLDPFNKTLYKHYSTGMKQKLKIAQALMEKPKVLVLDEPFNGLDEDSVKYFRQKFLEMKKEGITFIITSHYKEDIEELCNKVYKMNHGELEKYENSIL